MQPFKSQKPTVSLTMIVKDEEVYLHDCLESVRDIVDEIVIVDTGSTDKTVEIAQRFGARIFHYAWHDDFAAARNECLQHATGDWIFQIDADERLQQESKEEIRKWLKNRSVTCVSVIIDSPKVEQKKGHISRAHRLFRNLPEVKYTGRIHEQISPSVVALGGCERQSAIHLVHLGYDKSEAEMRRKSERNYRLLKKQVEEEPENAYAHFIFAQNLILNQKYEAAQVHLRQALDLGGLPKDIICRIHNNLAELHMHKGAYEQAVSFAERALAITKSQTTAYLLLHEIYGYLKDIPKQIRCLESAIAVVEKSHRHDPTVSVDAYVDPAMLYLNLGHRYSDTEDSAAASNNYRRAFQIAPDNPAVLAAFIDTLIRAGDSDEACAVLTRSPKTPANLEKLAWLYIKRQEFGRAVSTYEALLEHAPQNTDILKRLAALHQKLGNSHRAIDCLTKAKAS